MLTFGILQGVAIGVAFSLFWLAVVSSLPNIPELGCKIGTRNFMDLDDHPGTQHFPGLSILHFDGGLFFVNADSLGDRIQQVSTQAEPALNGVILDMEGLNFIDVEGADTIKKISQVGAVQHVDLHLANMKSVVKDILTHA